MIVTQLTAMTPFKIKFPRYWHVLTTGDFCFTWITDDLQLQKLPPFTVEEISASIRNLNWNS